MRLILTSVLLKIGRKGHQDRSRSSCEILRRQGAIAVERGQLGIGRQLTDPSTTPRRDKSEIPPYSRYVISIPYQHTTEGDLAKGFPLNF